MQYFHSLEKLISRYTSKNVAKRENRNTWRKLQTKRYKAGKATIISKCLEYLTISFMVNQRKELTGD